MKRRTKWRGRWIPRTIKDKWTLRVDWEIVRPADNSPGCDIRCPCWACWWGWRPAVPAGSICARRELWRPAGRFGSTFWWKTNSEMLENVAGRLQRFPSLDRCLLLLLLRYIRRRLRSPLPIRPFRNRPFRNSNNCRRPSPCRRPFRSCPSYCCTGSSSHRRCVQLLSNKKIEGNSISSKLPAN